MCGTLVAIFSGEYDLACKARFREDLKGIGSEPVLILDFSDVSYIDSACISELLGLQRIRRSQGFDPETIVVNKPTILRLFDVLGIASYFRCLGTLDEAVPLETETIVIYATRGGEEIVF